MKKKLISILLMLTLTVSLCAALGISASADDDGIEVSNVSELYEALENVKEGGTINLYGKGHEYAVDRTIYVETPCTINFYDVTLMQPILGNSFCYDNFIEVNANDVTLNFSNCKLNTADNTDQKRVCNQRGAAIHVDGKNCVINGNGTTTFENCKTSAKYGGAIYIDDGYSGCRISNCNFFKCEAANLGGAIYSADKDCVITNCMFHFCYGGDPAACFVYGEEKNQTKLVNCTDENGKFCDKYNCPGCIFWNKIAPADGYYILHTAANNDLCLGIEGGAGAKDSGACTQLQGVSTSDAKVFKFEKVKIGENDAYKIVAVHSGKSLGIHDTTVNNGVAICQQEDNGFWGQRWLFYEDGYGNVFIFSYAKDQNYCMDVAGMDIRENTEVYVWSYTGAENQQWHLEQIPAPSGFTLSEGSRWIVGIGAVVILGGVAAIVIVSKKRKASAV